MLLKYLGMLAILMLFATVSLAKDAKRPPITGIAFVRIYAKDPAASRKFYLERLRLPEVPCAGTNCAQFQVNKDQYVQIVPAGERNNGMEVVAFRTTDLEALRQYLAAHQVKVPGLVVENPDGSREFEIVDAEGHHIAFLQPGKDNGKRGGISHRMIHVGFVVKDRATMDKFYRDVLGFKPYWYGGFQQDHTIWVSSQVPDGTDWLEYMLDIPADASHHQLGVQNHFSLGTANINDAVAGLEKSGWTPTPQEHTQMGRDGKRQLNVWDPDEVRVEFMEFSPSEKPCCSDFTAEHPKAD